MDGINIKQKNSSPMIASLGTCNIDFLMKVPRFSEADDEVDIEDLHVSLGGSATNFAIGLSRAGLDVGLIARIGNDNYGQFAAEKLEKEGVKTDRLINISKPTGMAFIAVDSMGERSIYTSMGANAYFKLEKEDIDYIKSSRMLHITGMYREVAEEASKHAQFLSFNPGAALSAFGIEELMELIKRTDIIFLNKKEVSILTGEEYPEGAQKLVDLGVSLVIVTCGEHGAYLYTSDEVIHSPTHKKESLDTTGAGDAFASGFIAEFIKNNDLMKCLQMGNRSASACISRLGSVNISHP